MRKHKIITSFLITFGTSMPVCAAEITEEEAVKYNSNTPFDALVNAVYNSGLFQKYISTWGAPLNNASFIAALLVVIFILGIMTIVELVLNYRKSKKIYKINEEKMEKRRQQEAEDELLREYMRFKMLAETNNVESMQSITFEQWLAARVETGQVEMNSLTPEQREAVTEAKETISDLKENIVSAVSDVLPKKQPKTEEEEMDVSIAAREAEDERIRKAEEYQKRQEEQLREMRENNPVSAEASPKETATDPKPVSEGSSWLSNIDEIKKKYSTETKKTELVDLPDADETVHLSEAAVVKPVVIKEKPKPEELKPKQEKVDINKLLEEKTAEMKDDLGEPVPQEEMSQFDALVAALHTQKAAESKAKALSAEAEKAKEANIELLQNDLEDTLEGTGQNATARKDDSKENKALEEAKKRALKEMQRESSRRRK